ncbi:hypothetical protein V496_00437 [Pseudogymnoascus sp. VKM F-4515 (FW-2607)]|nr:hypothetical protein V496_00437 [Pseudogymnoascus sp. VKM F-4515 (FW-2607)]
MVRDKLNPYNRCHSYDYETRSHQGGKAAKAVIRHVYLRRCLSQFRTHCRGCVGANGVGYKVQLREGAMKLEVWMKSMHAIKSLPMATLSSSLDLTNLDYASTLASSKPPRKFSRQFVADKYDCKVALKHAIHHWLDHRNVVSLKDLMELMTAAYLLNHAQAFSAITYTMMMEHAGSYLPFAQDQIDFGVPWELFYLLEVRRDSIHKQLGDILSVNGKGLLPAPYLDRETALNRIKKVEQMGAPVEVEDSTACKNYRWHSPAYSQETTLNDLQGLKDGKGLCLNCISGGSPVYSERPSKKSIIRRFHSRTTPPGSNWSSRFRHEFRSSTSVLPGPCTRVKFWPGVVILPENACAPVNKRELT